MIIWLAAIILYKQDKFISKNKYVRHHTYQRGPAHSLGYCYIAIQKPCSSLDLISFMLIREETVIKAQLEFQILSIWIQQDLGTEGLDINCLKSRTKVGHLGFRTIVFKYTHIQVYIHVIRVEWMMMMMMIKTHLALGLRKRQLMSHINGPSRGLIATWVWKYWWNRSHCKIINMSYSGVRFVKKIIIENQLQEITNCNTVEWSSFHAKATVMFRLR